MSMLWTCYGVQVLNSPNCCSLMTLMLCTMFLAPCNDARNTLLLPVLYRAPRLLVFLALVLPESDELDVRCSRSLLEVGTDSAFLSL